MGFRRKSTATAATTGTTDDSRSSKKKNRSKKKKEKKKKGLRGRKKGTGKTTITTDEDSNKTREQQTSVSRSVAPKIGLVKPFVDATLRKGVKGLQTDFRKMKRMNDFTKMTEFVTQNAEGRNRYKDVGCLDNQRVIITNGIQPYIHANYVATPSNQRRFICTQGPLPKTCGDFWCMVVQERTTAVLMLCNFLEMGSKKCAEYFPQKEGSMEFDEGFVVVTFKSQKHFKFSIDTKVKIMVTTLEIRVRGQESHLCNHHHWLDWPDRGVPEADTAPIALLSNIRENKYNSYKFRAPIVVHCSAGIGRTGSIVLIEHMMDLLNSGKQLGEMQTYLEELRRQRNNSVQTEQQYLYVHQVMFCYLKKAGFLNDNQVGPYLEAFTKDYVKATTGF